MPEERVGGDIRPGRLTPGQCAANFADLVAPLKPNEARVAAERCLFCHDAPCVAACPTGIDIPLFIRQISHGQPVAAARTILDANIMGAMCARVCPTENLCEGACVKETSETRAVEIGRLQRYATDAAFAAGKQFYSAGKPTGKAVAVVGAGPAGLACAHALARHGHRVTIFEAKAKGGGLNEFGIAAYKANDDIAQRELDYILAVGGISVEYGKALGRDISLADIRKRFDAVFLGMGLGGTNDLGLGDGVSGIEDAVEFIAHLRQAADKSQLPVGRNVAVIGGGMTAIDAAVQARLIGAEQVTIAYRRSQAEMGASAYEQEVAQTRGVLIRPNLRPVRVEQSGGAVTGVTFEYTTSRDGALAGTGEMVTLPADQVLVAIGQALRAEDLAGQGLALAKGRIAVDEAGKTSLPGVWAGGDCVAGGLDLTVAAVEDGKQAARSIHDFLSSSANGKA
ncbi:NAD(P)-dependent oxidoreductase [Rhabdaerophilum sp.]|uniref:NAD(P)-dependent oxidoreductase n=1 Tax=Rhabdaerophilum sp. TaxID=2717341 RepID=UPI0038D39159